MQGLIVSPDFYEKIQRPHVQLVTSRIDRFTPTGIRTNDDTEHEFDVIVLSTGFRSDRFIRPTRVIGVTTSTSTMCGRQRRWPTSLSWFQAFLISSC